MHWRPVPPCPIRLRQKIVTPSAQKYDLLQAISGLSRELFDRRDLEETPKPDDPTFHPLAGGHCFQTTLCLRPARHTLSSKIRVEVDNSCDDWDYARASEHLVNRIRELRKDSERSVDFRGEVTVKVCKGGTGGRNQQFALSCVETIAGENMTVLSAGSDGIDGNSPATGAVVDGTTLARAQAKSLSPARPPQGL